MMTRLIEQVIAEIEKLPEKEQDALAERMLATSLMIELGRHNLKQPQKASGID
jgi:hypothetical protein